MPSLWEKAKAHPYMTAGIVFGVGFVIILLYKSLHSTSSNNGSAYAAYQQAAAAEAASGNQLAAVQAQAQAAGNQTNAEVAIGASHDATTLSIAQLENQTAQNHDSLAAQVAEYTASLQAQSTDLASSASVSINAQNNYASTIQNLFDTLVKQNPADIFTTENYGGYDVTQTGSYNSSTGTAQNSYTSNTYTKGGSKMTGSTGQSVYGYYGGQYFALTVTPNTTSYSQSQQTATVH